MKSFRSTVLAAIAFALVFVVSGCGDEPRAATMPTAHTAAVAMKRASAPARPAKATAGDILQTGDTDYGKIVQDSKGHTIYLFTKDRSRYSNCYGACAKAWTPVIVSGTPAARKGSGIKRSKLGTTRRRTGKLQATYNGHPLYYYVEETKAEQVLCQAAPEFGGIWYVLNSDGTANKTG
jgi:predicted lipoprotein with Yx(FWY)xxD motif